jgi:tryptophanyl-tRNA synthetase
MAKISLTGIKPTGTPHLGNYLGSIQPALELAKDYLSIYFIADYHALTTVKDRESMRKQSHQIAATWLALGLDPEKTVFFQQSLVPELFELCWILNCFCAKGLMNRAHAYKAMVDDNREVGRDLDEGINVGIFDYPVLMSADILLFGSDVVPVGADQKQHVEIARDLAESLNSALGNVFNVPQPLIRDNVKTIPGIDGRKMSKNYDNVIPIFDSPAAVRKRVMRIVTDSKTPEEPKDPETCNIFAIFRHFAPAERVETRRRQYQEGGLGYGEMKQELADSLEAFFAPARAKYDAWMQDTAAMDALLAKGAERARSLGSPRLEKIRKKIGVR